MWLVFVDNFIGYHQKLLQIVVFTFVVKEINDSNVRRFRMFTLRQRLFAIDDLGAKLFRYTLAQLTTVFSAHFSCLSNDNKVVD